MKSFLATTAIVLLMGGSAYAASAQFTPPQAQASDIDASKFIGQTVYATDTNIDPDQTVAAGAEKDWDNIGDINDIVMARDGTVKAVVLGVGGFLGMGEKSVAVSMNDIKFVKNGDGADDYFLVVNTTKEALNAAPSYRTPEEIRSANNANPANTTTDTAANPGMTAPADNSTNSAANSTSTTDMSKPADNTNTAANSTTDTSKPADTANNQASSTTTTQNNAAATNTDKTMTGSTTNNNTAVQTTMGENRTRLTPPNITREGYKTAQISELTSDKLEGARVYGPKDEDVGEINRLVMNDNGKGVKLFVLDVGGFLGIGEHQIAVTPQELNIVRNANGDDVRVYIDANKQALKAQPEYKTQ